MTRAYLPQMRPHFCRVARRVRQPEGRGGLVRARLVLEKTSSPRQSGRPYGEEVVIPVRNIRVVPVNHTKKA